MSLNLQKYQKTIYTLLTVLVSVCMFSNNNNVYNNDVLFIENGVEVTGFESIYQSPVMPFDQGIIYVRPETYFYYEDSISAKVVFYFSPEPQLKCNERSAICNNSKLSSTNNTPDEISLTPKNSIPFDTKNLNFSAGVTNFVASTFKKEPKKELFINNRSSFFLEKNEDGLFRLHLKNKIIYNRYNLRYFSLINNALFGRPPPIFSIHST